MSGTGAILCVGRLYCALVFTGLPAPVTPGREVFANALSLHAGGGAAITAGWLASLGARAELCAHWPAPPFRDPVAAELDAANVGTALCAPATGPEPQITVAVAHGDDRAFLTRAPGPPAPRLSAEDLARSHIRHVHVGELRTLLDRPDLIDAARRAGATVSSDCGWDDDIGVEAGDVLRAVDVFLPNADEAERLTSLGVGGAPLTVVKRGADGAEAWGPSGRIATRPAPAVAVVDATGAGDAFAAGFLSRWVAGAEIGAALEAGVTCGSRAVTRAGGLGALAQGAAA